MDIRAVTAASNYAASRPATRAEPVPGGPGNTVAKAFEDFETTLRNSETAAVSAMTGNADPHALVQALAQTELAVETAVAVRNKVVEAYQEILRMPV